MNFKPFLLAGGVVGTALFVASYYWAPSEGGFWKREKTGVPVYAAVARDLEQDDPDKEAGSGSREYLQEGIESSRRNAIVRATEIASRSVVTITVTRARKARRINPFFDDPFFDLFFHGDMQPLRESVSSIGSGVLVSDKGYIVTNSHVINTGRGEKRLDIMVHLTDGREFKAKVIGMDVDNDVAVIKIHGNNLPAARIQKQYDNLIGEWVVAIGNPFGYLMSDSKPTVTVGVISALGRNFTAASGIGYFNMIQTDASVNPGNSGGALVNAEGRVIGINTFIITGPGNQSGSIGIGFAIPIQKAMRVVRELITYGYIRQWTTGIYTNPYMSERSLDGILISSVDKGSPGEKSGLRKGDVIYRVAGQDLSSIHEFMELLRKFQVGEKVEIGFIRGNRKMKTTMVLEEKKRKY
ncbi:trypsin-like peptidase domain-containing protein [Fibrobacterota bacterium]